MSEQVYDYLVEDAGMDRTRAGYIVAEGVDSLQKAQFVALEEDVFIADLVERAVFAMEPEKLQDGVERLRALRELLWTEPFENHVASFLLSDAIERGEEALRRAQERARG